MKKYIMTKKVADKYIHSLASPTCFPPQVCVHPFYDAPNIFLPRPQCFQEVFGSLVTPRVALYVSGAGQPLSAIYESACELHDKQPRSSLLAGCSSHFGFELMVVLCGVWM